MGFFYGIILAIGLIAAITLIQSWRKQRAWRGTVTEIKERPAAGIDGLDTKDTVDIHYRTNDGRRGRLRFFKGKFEKMYPDLKVGDRLVKEVGEVYPKKEG